MTDGQENIESRNSGGLSSLASAALPLLRKLMHKKGMVSADIITMWERIVGSEVAQYTIPEKLEFVKGARDRGTLWLKVPGGAFALELRHREKFLVERINTFFGYNAVEEIKIIQDVGTFRSLESKSNQPPMQKNLVSKEEQNYISRVTEDITNAELREKLREIGEVVFSQNHK